LSAFVQIVQHFKVMLAIDFASRIALPKNLFGAGSGVALLMFGRAVIGAGIEAITDSLSSSRKLSFDRLPGW
jgi:hypothetical protein